MKKKKSGKLVLWIFILAFIFAFFLLCVRYYHFFLTPNIDLPGDKKKTFLYVPTGAGFDDLLKIMTKNRMLINKSSFVWVAKKMSYTDHIHAGRFLLKDRMNNYELIKMLRANANIPVKLVLNDQKTVEDLAGYIGAQLEIDSAQLIQKLYDEDFLKSNLLTKESVLAFFIPNTYEIYWNISIDDFIKRMGHEYYKIWNEKRLRKAKEINLTPVEVAILASIIQGETNHLDEMPRIAGVYLNRLKTNMKLEADPTITFLIKSRKVLRIYSWDLDIDSPYNTYKYKGLPPGPIGFSRIGTIDAVLNPEKHNYLYFCARPDDSGYHNFSKNIEQHRAFARQYHQYLNSHNIK